MYTFDFKFFIYLIIKTLIIVLPILLSVAYFTHIERKIMGTVQRRQGPNVVGTFGILQALADGLKLLVKEVILPSNANLNIFLLTPVLTFSLSLMNWAVIPFDAHAYFININLSLLYLFAISSLSIYGILLSGWASNSKYSFLGSIRSAAQMISYEVCIGFILLIIVLISGSFSLIDIIQLQISTNFLIIFEFILFFIFLICILAETNRHPFDLPEAESELVSGYNTEYSSMSFALFFLGEYANMLLMSSLTVILFCGGWLMPDFYLFNIIPGSFFFAIKTLIFVIFFAWMRVLLPRYRYDQLMMLGWKKLLPFIIFLFLLSYMLLILFNGIPNILF